MPGRSEVFMLLDIQKMTMGAQELQQGSFLADFSGEDFPVGFALKAPASAAYETVFDGSEVLLRLSIVCETVIQCDLCLTKVQREMRFQPEYRLSARDWDCEDPELPFTKDGKLDLTRLCYDEILLGIPSRLLCKPDCEGLCPVCGKPVSAGCSCRQNVGDDRLSILKQLLS